MSTKRASEQPQQMKVAYHEAGHAVMAIIVGRPIQKVTISAANMSTGGVRLGACKIRKGRSKPSKDWLEEEALIFFAGMVAESHFTGQYCEQGAGQDLRVVRRLLSQREQRRSDDWRSWKKGFWIRLSMYWLKSNIPKQSS